MLQTKMNLTPNREDAYGREIAETEDLIRYSLGLLTFPSN